MISLKEASELINNSVSPLNHKKIPIVDSVNCKLTDDLHSPINVPGFVSSAMDGIAILYSDLHETGPWKLKIQETIAAGDSPNIILQKGCSIKIMTGAPLPMDADTVIPVEELTFQDDVV